LFSALDIKTYAMALLKGEYRQSAKRNMPRHWFDPLPRTHHALDDAIEQGALFWNMLRENAAGSWACGGRERWPRSPVCPGPTPRPTLPR
jgi:hypothetical protein